MKQFKIDEYEKAYKEYYIYSFEDTALASGSGNTFDDVTVRMDSDADFEVMKRCHVATDNRIRVKFQDDSAGRQFQNASLDIRGISGTKLETTGVVDVGISLNNFIPFILPNPYLIRAGTTYTSSFADFSGATNSIRMAFHGAKIRAGRAPWKKNWKAKLSYDYTTESLSVAAGGTINKQISIQIDSHFLVQKIVGVRNSGAPSLVTIKTGGYDKQWMDKPVHFDNLVGNAQFPNVLPAPRIVERGATINVSIQNLSSVNAGTYEIIFCGLKLF
jgi:hypothetical protein